LPALAVTGVQVDTALGPVVEVVQVVVVYPLPAEGEIGVQVATPLGPVVGLDIPEVSLVAILDADKEGFLRSVVSLVQTIGRAARNLNGKAILYADKITRSMQQAIDETDRRREKQREFNIKHHIEPASVYKSITDILQTSIPGSGFHHSMTAKVAETQADYALMNPKQLSKKLKQLEDAMYQHAKNLEFEQAAKLRDEIKRLQEQVLI
jgi:excinuclease ABC subunit B